MKLKVRYNKKEDVEMAEHKEFNWHNYGSGLNIRTSIREAIKLVGKLPKKSYYIRFDTRDFIPGDCIPSSHNWIGGEPTDRLLPGVCALDPNLDYSHEWFNHDGYYGHVYIIKGRISRRGKDSGEVIVRNAIVVKRIK
jgi:hypothetical protein